MTLRVCLTKIDKRYKYLTTKIVKINSEPCDIEILDDIKKLLKKRTKVM